MDEGVSYVAERDVERLRDALDTAARDFNTNFNALDAALNKLTSTGLTGEGADVLMNTYNTKVKPALDQINTETQKATGYAEDQVESTSKLMNTLEDIGGR